MPLSVPALLEALPGAAGRPGPASVADAAAQWAAAMQAYVAAIIPFSTTIEAATLVLEAGLATAFAARPAVALMESAFAQYAVALGGGMAGAGFVATPPPAPVGFAALFAMGPAATREEGLQRLAAQIDVWMKTGIAALSAPPNTPQPWA